MTTVGGKLWPFCVGMFFIDDPIRECLEFLCRTLSSTFNILRGIRTAVDIASLALHVELSSTFVWILEFHFTAFD